MEELFYYQEALCAESTDSFMLLRTSLALPVPQTEDSSGAIPSCIYPVLKGSQFWWRREPQEMLLCPSADCKLASVAFLCLISCRSRGGLSGLKTLFFLDGPGFRG